MIFVPPIGGYNKKIFRLASLAVICTPHLCKRCAAPASMITMAVSITVYEIFSVNSVTLKTALGVVQGH